MVFQAMAREARLSRADDNVDLRPRIEALPMRTERAAFYRVCIARIRARAARTRSTAKGATGATGATGAIDAPGALDANGGAAAEPVADYERVVAPILATRCGSCHGERRQRGGLESGQLFPKLR